MSDLSIENLFSVKGIVALITGGGSGIGLMIAKALDANGAEAVYIVGRREEVLQNAAKQGINGKIIPVVGDVTSKDSLAAIAARIEKDHGFLNVLVANSGIIGIRSDQSLPSDHEPSLKEFKEGFWQHSMEDFTQASHVNVTAVFYTCLAFLELLDAGNTKKNVSQTSQIITIASIASFSRQAAAGYPYSTSKAGVMHLMKILSTRFAKWDIRCNVIAPGPYPSEMTSETKGVDGKKPTDDGGLPKTVVPLGRMGREEDMAGTAITLIAKSGAYINGNVIITDGGRLTQLPSVY